MTASPVTRLRRLQQRSAALLDRLYPSEHKVLVFGEGNARAAIMLVGEAPGEQETLQQRPFVGQAGRILDDFLARIGLPRDALYITSVVKFRPTRENPQTGRLNNRPPTREEIDLCWHMLAGEIEIVAPRVVVTLGNVALRALLQDNRRTIGACHGQPFQTRVLERAVTVFPLYHPASILYNRALQQVYARDVDALAALLRRWGLLPAAGPETPEEESSHEHSHPEDPGPGH